MFLSVLLYSCFELAECHVYLEKKIIQAVPPLLLNKSLLMKEQHSHFWFLGISAVSRINGQHFKKASKVVGFVVVFVFLNVLWWFGDFTLKSQTIP